ncbi:glycosyltransferase [Spirochaetota bacterium]
MKEKRVLISGGGTGGHIVPGIAIYKEFKNRNINVLFLSDRRDVRFSSIKDISPDDLCTYNAPPFTRNVLMLPIFAIKFAIAVIKARMIMRRNNVHVVIGMGGYVTAPVLAAAKMRKTTICLCEQNSVPGKVTSLFEKHALRVYSTLPVTRDYLKYKEKFLHSGNPINKKVFANVDKDEAKKVFHLRHCDKVILVIGGSQGALKINELVFGLKKEYEDDLKNVGIIWSTGDFSYKKFKELVHNEIDEGSMYLSPYINEVGMAYKACDIAISRSGAGVIMELAAMGIPSIQIPYPHAAMDHQDKNADYFVKVRAAIKVKNSDAVPEKVAPLLLDLLNNPRLLNNMSEKAKSLSKIDASEFICDDVIKNILKIKVDISAKGPSGLQGEGSGPLSVED